ncbi:MAG: sodium:solute symporter family protein [Calditrichia bacterium]
MMIESINFTWWDWIPLTGYLGLLLVIGFKTVSGYGKDDFILSGRALTLPGFVATLVSTWYGGILGVGEFTYLYGISNWVVFGLPYYIFAFIYARFLLPKFRQENMTTIPELFRKYTDSKTSVVSAWFVFIISNPAPYLFMAGMMVSFLFPVPLWLGLLLVVLFSSFYLVRGGFSAVVKTDILQFVIMFAGFALIIPFLMKTYGGIPALIDSLPRHHLSFTGGNSLSFIFLWYFLALITLVDPNFYQRCMAARDVKTAQRGIYISLLFWFIFDGMTTLTGLYAKAFMEVPVPVMTYPALAQQILPPFLKGLFITALLATIMSSLDSFTFVSTVTLSNDILQKWVKKNRYHRLYISSLGITLIISYLMALMFDSVIQLWYIIANIAVPPLLIPIILIFWLKKHPPAVLVSFSMIASGMISMIDLVLGQVTGKGGSFLFPALEPLYTGLILNILIYTIYFIRLKIHVVRK